MKDILDTGAHGSGLSAGPRCSASPLGANSFGPGTRRQPGPDTAESAAFLDDCRDSFSFQIGGKIFMMSYAFLKFNYTSDRIHL